MLEDISAYYSGKLAQFGESPSGVDWNSLEAQTIRFDQLLRIIDRPRDFSIADLGCGYGALLDYMRLKFNAFQYRGVDISETMIDAARQRAGSLANAAFETGSAPSQTADYIVASGIFSVKLSADRAAWEDHFYSTLRTMDSMSVRGFSFNSLTSYSDAERMRDDLFYANPLDVFDFCKRNFSRQVALLHDYGLWEFTILVRKG